MGFKTEITALKDTFLEPFLNMRKCVVSVSSQINEDMISGKFISKFFFFFWIKFLTRSFWLLDFQLASKKYFFDFENWAMNILPEQLN